MTQITLVCPACSAVNRVPVERVSHAPRCGACHKPLFTAQPVPVDEASLVRHIRLNDIPVLVDIWAPWCGPCVSMAPYYEQAAAQLEPHIRLLKLNADTAPQTMAKYSVRSIPSLLLFSANKLKAQSAGAMTTAQITQWARHHVA
ncbi:MAG: thioredoxin TrxC [Acidocella sp. 20-57-95]|nr:MAG: thioredoxin TrxC [Acidocella sp. 20-57-95]OYV57583.1 MAG: thioredoxin TrxC [Acidocella sp. 21-58-7]HQT63831.1 thioredoxin TrxC [Acidocella sp.]HQU05508.1 thioredoxin TrxC [Acidocella sp.]